MNQPIPNVELLTKTLAWAEAQAALPDLGEWYQGAWWIPFTDLAEDEGIDLPPEQTCGTAYCFAGKVAIDAGGKIAQYKTSYRLGFSDTYLVATPEEIGAGDHEDLGFYTTPVVTVQTRVRRLLGLSYDEGDQLFAEHNTIEDLRRVVGEILQRALSACRRHEASVTISSVEDDDDA